MPFNSIRFGGPHTHVDFISPNCNELLHTYIFIGAVLVLLRLEIFGQYKLEQGSQIKYFVQIFVANVFYIKTSSYRVHS